MIKRSFIKGGINLKFDGAEYIHFDWPKRPNIALVEKLPYLNLNNNIKNYMEFDIKENKIIMKVILMIIFYLIMNIII